MGRCDCNEDMLAEAVISSEKIYSGRVFDCEVRQVRLPDGNIAKREVVVHSGGACVLPVDDELNCYMVKQFRTGVGKVYLEAPAGRIENGESPEDCVLREITEETGYKASHLESLGSAAATPGYCSELIHLYIATGLEYQGTDPDAGEFLKVCKVPLSELLKMAEDGQIEDGKTQILIYKAARRLLVGTD
ncbi:MAG: NUDIX hydrolase [Clostridiales bacterium]|nr:NUDIX hydrolase [Clostridiales bacterium]